MRSRIFSNPILTIFVAVSFLGLTFVGCAQQRTVGFDEHGRAITQTDNSGAAVFWGVLLALLVVGALAAASSVHGSLDNTTVKISLPDDHTGDDSKIFTRQLNMDSLRNIHGLNYKPVKVFDSSGSMIHEFAAVFDAIPRSGDKILARLSKTFLKDIPSEQIFHSDKVTNNMVVKLLVDSDFSPTSHRTGMVKIKEVSFAQNPLLKADHQTTLYYGDKKFIVFVDIDKL